MKLNATDYIVAMHALEKNKNISDDDIAILVTTRMIILKNLADLFSKLYEDKDLDIIPELNNIFIQKGEYDLLQRLANPSDEKNDEKKESKYETTVLGPFKIKVGNENSGIDDLIDFLKKNLK